MTKIVLGIDVETKKGYFPDVITLCSESQHILCSTIYLCPFLAINLCQNDPPTITIVSVADTPFKNANRNSFSIFVNEVEFEIPEVYSEIMPLEKGSQYTYLQKDGEDEKKVIIYIPSVEIVMMTEDFMEPRFAPGTGADPEDFIISP